MIELEEKYIFFIKETISSVISDYRLYIFGSRVTGESKKYSDVDIAIDSNELTTEMKFKIFHLFENSTFPYEVDIIDLKTVSDRFMNLIKDELIEIT